MYDILVVGMSHKTAPANIREKVAFTNSQKIEVLNNLMEEGILEAVILSTCNRSEIYIACGQNTKEQSIRVLKRQYQQKIQVEDYEKYLYVKGGKEGARHLFDVTAGLQSVVMGEDQILGQVKEALQTSMEMGGSKKVLNKVFREAITTAKMIKNKYKISQKPLSVSYIGIQYLKKSLGSLEGKTALVIGGGKMGQLAVKYLWDENIGKVYIANRNLQKMEDAFQDNPRIKTLHFQDRYQPIKEVDMIITSTASPHIILEYSKFPTPNQKIAILDMAMPRDVDERIGQMPGVSLYDIDHLQELSQSNEKERIVLSKKAGDIITQEIESLYQWLKTLQIHPVIKGINEQCKEIEKDTLQYINRKIELNPREQKIIEKTISAALKRLVRKPILKIKEEKHSQRAEEYMEMLYYLYDLEKES